MTGINGIDIVVLVCVAFPTVSGFRHGLVAGLLRLAGLFAGLALAVWKMPLASQFATATLGIQGSGAPLAALAAGVFGGWILGMLTGWAWKRFSEGTQIGWADRLAGLAMGLVKGAAFALALLAGASLATPKLREPIRSSWTGRHALDPAVNATRVWMEGRIEAWKK